MIRILWKIHAFTVYKIDEYVNTQSILISFISCEIRPTLQFHETSCEIFDIVFEIYILLRFDQKDPGFVSARK